MPTTLITIPMSHYCDKARWGLEFYNIEYKEDAHMQGLHWLHSLPRSGSRTVPVLLHNGKSICDSTDILKYLDSISTSPKKLYPDNEKVKKEIAEIEYQFNEVLGMATRIWIYPHVFARPDLIMKYACEGAPKAEKFLISFCIPILQYFVNKKLDITPEKSQAAVEDIKSVFDLVEQKLSDGRKFICGDQFTAADITFATMAAPVLMPHGYGIPLPQPEEWGGEAEKVMNEFRQSKAGGFAMDLYANLRK